MARLIWVNCRSGYFEIHEKNGTGMITAAVVAKNTPVDNTPIAIDAATSWLYSDPQQIRDVCTLSANCSA